MNKIIASILFLSVTFFSCKKKTEQPAITIEGFSFFDYTGNPIGSYGEPDKDWQFVDRLSEAEMNLFNFPTSLSLDNTSMRDSALYFYPNPCYQKFNIYSKSVKDSVLLRIVITDNYLNVLESKAIKCGASSLMAISIDDAVKFPLQSERRIYFSLSASGNENYKVGYGDIKICNSFTPLDCFK